MANILYGVNGEGSGHSMRAKEVICHLQRQGHAVHIVSFDRGLANLRQDFAVTEIHGWRLSYLNNRVRYGRTLTKNLLGARKTARSIAELERLSEQWNIDLVVTDFEPFSCHVGHRKGLPVISVDNQHSLTHTDVSYPRQYRRDAMAAKMVVRLMVPRANAYLVISFFNAKVIKPNTFLFPPILRESVLEAKPESGDHVLVYVTSPALALANLLKSVRCPFVAYGFGREGQEGNILFRKPSQEHFLQDLAGAKAVIANAGFSLVSEAMQLGKPFLAVPMEHQFEQIFTAHWVHKLGYGAYWDELNRERVESFLYNLAHFREKLEAYPRRGNGALLNKLDSVIAQLTSPSRAAGMGSA